MLKPARNKEKDPEGRMPLAEHLRELRNRLAKAMLAIVVVTAVAAFYYNDIINFFTKPVLESVGCPKTFAEVAKMPEGKQCAQITINGLLAPFTLALKVSLMAGVALASPVWLYQLWAFVAPGLHRSEKKYAYAFVGTGVPLFMGGAFFAYKVLPTTAKVLMEFTPNGVSNLLPLDDLLDLVTRMVVVFGLSFELPLLLVMLNLTGILTGKRMLGWWRGMIMGITVFAALATPSTDPLTMLALAGPIWILYFGAVAFSLVNDRRKRRREAEGPDDDEASELDLTPEDIGEIETVSANRALPEQSVTDRVNGYDDVT
ncbi:twin arginine-targeting protein translocase TatC [Streptomyces avermitilis]|uniref:Sec-independent protein translocase protein TatC n=2 Tax=Streptomyces avermitilis TaxID=33903 RepID=Q828H6_STRAW|nr:MULTISPECIES: twin-arginine translocase subunit TatC [Streptomyces]KUN53756.1 twin arginine-targeting protein translocase TatC [Streptomyces avermitilis]MYT02236.1 twin-arginine translocase subunit TatC [Streptomyces sp. SID5469]OOV27250.1 twin arginine-targeting protein translocase TatC [Streptomyces avermitilis]BAC74404.1 putative sec-independent protein translocase protein TatC [Streptomyces avermitilis MA-4680 = NBRC 14893]GDY66953.1 Sec-independent protein translocase protein TatC [Str